MSEGMPVCPKCKGTPDAINGCTLCNHTGVVSEQFGFPILLANYTYDKVEEIERTVNEAKTTLVTVLEELDYIHGKVTAIWNAVKPGE